jgi:hypothetical protein
MSLQTELLNPDTPGAMSKEAVLSELYNEPNGLVHKFEEWTNESSHMEEKQRFHGVTAYYRANDLFNRLREFENTGEEINRFQRDHGKVSALISGKIEQLLREKRQLKGGA